VKAFSLFEDDLGGGVAVARWEQQERIRHLFELEEIPLLQR
jgi:hypothetical protein